MSAPSHFLPFEHGTCVDKVIGYRSDAAEMDLIDEATLRQSAANSLLSVLSGLVNFDEANRGEISSCFLAVKILAEDATALRNGADERRRVQRCGGSQ